MSRRRFVEVDDDELEVFHEELDLVLSRANDLLVDQPAFVVADLIHYADYLAGVHNVDFEVTVDPSGIAIVEADDEAAAFLGVGTDPSRLDELEEYDRPIALLKGRSSA